MLSVSTRNCRPDRIDFVFAAVVVLLAVGRRVGVRPTETTVLSQGEQMRAELRRGIEEGWAAEKILFASNRAVAPDTDHFQIWMTNPDGSGPQQMTFGDVNDQHSELSPDGTKVAFVRVVKPMAGGKQNCTSIWIRDILAGVDKSHWIPTRAIVPHLTPPNGTVHPTPTR